MLRVGDCPCDVLKNRVGIINLRMTSGKTAVHSDMIMWNMNDSAENAALQFASILYGVPQVSVRVDKLPEDHYRMLKYYISFWKEHKDILLDGRLTAEHPECWYSSACSTLGDKAVITTFTDSVVAVDTDSAVVVNATKYKSLIIKNAKNKSFRVVNCMGDTLSQGIINNDIEEINVPVSGMVYLDKQ